MALLQRDKPHKSGAVQRVVVLFPDLLQALDRDGSAKAVSSYFCVDSNLALISDSLHSWVCSMLVLLLILHTED